MNLTPEQKTALVALIDKHLKNKTWQQDSEEIKLYVGILNNLESVSNGIHFPAGVRDFSRDINCMGLNPFTTNHLDQLDLQKIADGK